MVFTVFLETAIIVSNLIVLIYFIYTFIISILAFRRPKAYPAAVPVHRFAFLIAARNEEAVIGNLVDSLLRQDYPRELFDIIVIPNNCTDNTAAAALAAGARVMKCHVPVRTKGDVLNFAYPVLSRPESGYDAICVLDADNLVHPGFLAAMNNALCAGVEVAQGYRDSKNPQDSGIAGSSSIYFWLIDRFLMQSRANTAFSVGLGGCGFMIATSVLRRIGQIELKTLTEDTELTILCRLADARVAWVPEARIYDEQPTEMSQSWKQRMRWSGGMYQISRLYTLPIIRQAVKKKDPAALDLISIYGTVHMNVLWFFATLANTGLGIASIINYNFSPVIAWSAIVSGLVSSWLTATGAAVLTLVLEKKLKAVSWRGIMTFWVFLMAWLPINIICFFRKPVEWAEIRHEKNIRIEDIS